MRNISVSGKNLVLKPSLEYIAIDSLYLKEISKGVEDLGISNLCNEIREKIFPFPYLDIPFAEFFLENSVFNIKDIIKAEYDTIDLSDKRRYFASDTGLLLLIPLNLIKKFASLFNYDDLVDGPLDGINLDYLQKINSEFEWNDIGLIIAPGVDSGYEFEGGGVYKINI